MDNSYLEELFYLITLPVLSGIIHYFYYHCFTCRVEKNSNLVLCYLLYFVCSVALHFSSWPDTILLFVNVCLIIFLTLLYTGNLKWKICASLFIVVLIFLSDAAMPAPYSTKGYIINLFLSKLLMLFLVLISVRITKAYGSGILSKWYWLILFFCPFLSIIGVTNLLSSIFFQTYPEALPILSSGLLIINFLLFLLSDRILCIQSEQNKNLILEQQNTYYVNQYFMTKKIQEESFRFQHDFKNILLGIRAKLQSGTDTLNTQELDVILGKIESSSKCLDSGNIVIDSIINYKQQVAGRFRIVFDIDLNIPPDMKLDTTVISAILGNAIDNAIEACKENSNINRFIKIHMHYHNESLFIRIQNPYANKIHKNLNGELCSTKPDKHAHGFGLKNIKKNVEDSSGLLNISYQNNLFQIEIILFRVGSGI